MAEATGTPRGGRPEGRPETRVEGEWEYQPVRLPPDVTRLSAAVQLGLQAEFGGWELSRTLLYADGTRKVWLRRKVSRALQAGLAT